MNPIPQTKTFPIIDGSDNSIVRLFNASILRTVRCPQLTIFMVVFISGIMIILNILLIFIPNKKKSGKTAIGIINAALAIAAIVCALLSLEVNKPKILPWNGMLTEEHPEIQMKSDAFTKIYYTDDPNIVPADDGIRYSSSFIPEKSGVYYVQSKFLFQTSDVVSFPFTTYQDSLEKFGNQIGKESIISTPNYMSSNVSMEKAIDGQPLPEDIISGWGDNSGGRASYTIDEINNGQLYDQIIFNTISDSTIGNEKNYVAAKELWSEENKELPWKSILINVEVGKTYRIRLYGHNNSPKDYDRVAEDVKIQFAVPESSGRTIAVHGLISSSNASPSLYWDGVVLTCDDPFHLEYEKAIFFNNGMEETALPAEVMNNWVTVGYDRFDGQIPGCYQYSFVAVLYVKVIGD